jgi:hypothetical protein
MIKGIDMINMDDNELKLITAIRLFDAANAQDPNREIESDISHPKELLYARRMSLLLHRLYPNSSTDLQLAVRCQHLRRWSIPRSNYPEGKTGYHRWRKQLAHKHAEDAGVILMKVGYDEKTIERVQQLVRKEDLNTDAESQILEDVACLVFLQYYVIDIVAKHGEEKTRQIIAKILKKMSSAGRAAIDRLDLSDNIKGLLPSCLITEL